MLALKDMFGTHLVPTGILSLIMLFGGMLLGQYATCGQPTANENSDKFDTLRKRKIELEGKVQRLETQVNASSPDATQQVSDLNARIKELEESCNAQEDELTKLRASLAGSAAEKSSASALAALRKEFKEFQVQSARKIYKLTSEAKTKDDDLVHLRTAAGGSTRSSSPDVASLRKQLTDKDAAHQAKVSELQTAVSTKDEELMTRRTRLATLEKEALDVQAVVKKLIAKIKTLEDTVQKLQPAAALAHAFLQNPPNVDEDEDGDSVSPWELHHWNNIYMILHDAAKEFCLNNPADKFNWEELEKILPSIVDGIELADLSRNFPTLIKLWGSTVKWMMNNFQTHLSEKIVDATGAMLDARKAAEAEQDRQDGGLNPDEAEQAS